MALLRKHEGVMLWQDGLLQLFQYLQDNRAVCLCAMHSMSREHLRALFPDRYPCHHSKHHPGHCHRSCNYQASDQELTLLTGFYVGALVNMVEAWLLGEIEASPKELIDFVDQTLRDHVRGVALRLSEATPHTDPFL